MEIYTHKRIHELLYKAQNPVFVSDERVDGDSLGAALAMVDYAHGIGKHPRVYVSQNVPEQYQFLPHVESCTTDMSLFADETIDLIMVFDCSDGDYVKRLTDLIPARPVVINIDHHKTNPRYGEVNQVIIEASATAEVVYRFFEANHVLPSKDAATCMLAGICFDTNAFSNSATSEGALKISSDLILAGARVQDVIRIMFQNRSISALRVWGAALERLFHHPGINIVTTCLTRKDIEENHVTDDEIDGLSNFLNLVTDTDTLFVLRETQDGAVKVSMRSRNRDVSLLAKAFYGGGHAKAAGFVLPNTHLTLAPNGIWKVEKTDKS